MKKLLSIFVVSCLLAMSCNNNKQAINSKDLQGRYEIDLSAVVSQLTADEDNDFAKAFAAMLLAKLDLTTILKTIPPRKRKENFLSVYS